MKDFEKSGFLWRMFVAVFMLCALPAWADRVQVFEQAGFPSVDTAPLDGAALHSLFPGAVFVDAGSLADALNAADTSLLVMPYGSAFPESAWPALKSYLDRGGNLLVLGGRPFTRAAYRENGAWKLRDYSIRFTSELMIDQYEATPGSGSLQFLSNPDAVIKLPAFQWQRGFSPILHLSASRISDREGSAGRIDARITALAWGMEKGRPLSAPVEEIDHLRERFTGGRWIFLTADLPADFAATPAARELIATLVAAAQRGAEELQVEPTMPLYAEGEPAEIRVRWISSHPSDGLTVKITVAPDGAPGDGSTQSVPLTNDLTVTFPAPASKGLRSIDAELIDKGGHTVAVAHSGFWVRDEAYLLSGPKLTVNQNYFELNGKTLAVVGTTYMSSDVQRLYYEHPNVYVWNRDLGEIAGAGINMLRTGWWSGWSQLCDENGMPYERTLRTLEAYLMTARKYNLPVQFNVFAFLPDVLGGTNAYLDPVAVAREKTLYFALASRFGKVPFLAWDLINEPSFSQYHWTSRPNGDPIELAQWNAWLKAKYPDRAALAAAWNIAPVSPNATLPVPERPRAPGLHDFYLFSQDKFAAWVAEVRATIHSAGSEQLITVGQDEGGNSQRLLAAYFGGSVDFTANHAWNQNDNLLWNVLLAKQPGKPVLIQEMGVGSGIGPEGVERRSVESQAALFERKVVLSFAQGAGAIEWLWNTNADMLEDGEVALGGVRADGTQKPETDVMRGLASFAKQASPRLDRPERPEVAIVTSQAAQFSWFQQEQNQAQQRAVQALCYQAHVPGYIVAENQIAELGNPRLAILPSAQALGEPAWQALLAYARQGGNLLITGPVDRDTYWHRIDRAGPIGIQAAEPLTFRTSMLDGNGEEIPMTFSQESQNTLAFLRFKDGKTLEQLPYGSGHIFWASAPVELADDPAAAGRLYASVLKQIGLQPLFTGDAQLSPGVLVYPTVLSDSVLYLFASTDSKESEIDIKDKLTGARMAFHLGSQHGAAILLDKKTGAVLAHYGD